MSYQVKFTETTNPAKPAITVADQTLNNETSITFPGKNYSGYGPVVAENFLHLLENFAGPQPGPLNPVQGQLWYDNTAGVNLLKVFDGTNWTAAGSLKKDTSAPLASNSIKGDLWVNTETLQLYLFSGSNWILVGPQFSSGAKTGPEVETIVDTNDQYHPVISMYSQNYRIAIISKDAFTPKSVIAGFTTINQGVNLSSVDATSDTAPTKFWGTASTSDALNVAGAAIKAENFLRSDVSSTTNWPLSIRNNGGLNVGSDLSFSISLDSAINTINLQSKNSGHSISLKTNNAGTNITSIYVNADGKVGFGINNTNPEEVLDVDGNILLNGTMRVTDTTDATSPTVGSIKTAGGLGIAKQLQVGGTLSTYNQIVVNNLNINSEPVAGTVITPGSDSANNLYDIGSPNRSFRNIYAQAFVGSFQGTFNGGLTGDITGSAARLASSTRFNMTGDVTSDGFDFDGQTQTGTVTFTTAINAGIITSKPQLTTSVAGDQLLVYRSGADSGLKRITKQNFISNIPTVPVGAIFPYAGTTIPNGYLLCDGSEVSIATYSLLFQAIGYTYKRTGFVGKNTFGLPDLRGRFALGRDNMDNGTTVPSITNEQILVNAGGGPANRVVSPIADNVGEGSGSEERVLTLSNLPDHKHNMYSGNAQYFAAGSPTAPADPSAVEGFGLPSTGTGYGLPNSGAVSATNLGQPFNTMNPYLTINYIIFTGAVE
jgi:microcystin-dependent protein